MTEFMKNFNLKDKIGLVTGGTGLLGKEHAEALLEVGASIVILADRDSKSQRSLSVLNDLKNKYPEAKIFLRQMDVTKLEEIQSVHNEFNANGGIDILINNAAIDAKVDDKNEGLKAELTRFEEFPLDEWNRQIEVGLTGAYLCSQVFGKYMVLKGKGVILNISSDLSIIAPDQRIYTKEGLSDEEQPVKPPTYPVIKTALLGLTRYLAIYWAAKGIRVNSLSPGSVYNNHPEGFVERLTNLIPMGRMADKNEYRAAVQFLCSDASSYMTGQNIVIDGGRTCW